MTSNATCHPQAKHSWQTLNRLQDLPQAQTIRLFRQADTPFNRFEFLSALEASGCVGPQTGWLPHHQLLLEEGEVTGILIAYLKTHSYGEYVFDWAWAEAYHRHEIPYYPKLLSAIPFTPVPCSKWLSTSQISNLEALEGLRASYADTEVSGVHSLYPGDKLVDMSSHTEHWIHRQGHQFHWFNRHPVHLGPYRDFDDFLQGLTARKRKNIKKERKQFQEAGFNMVWRTGDEVNEVELEAFYAYYQHTYHKRGQQGYLTRRFFELIFASMPEQVRLLLCCQNDQIQGAALYFISEHTLYGRYWGSNDKHPLLHFEACYYQGIEFAIRLGLSCFNPGTQGEHKIARGFEPITTHSYHSLYLAPFQTAIRDFCAEEQRHNRDYMQVCRRHLPYKRDIDLEKS